MEVLKQTERAVRIREACQLLGIKKSSVYNLMDADSSFPKGIKIRGARVWLVSDLMRWLDRRAKR